MITRHRLETPPTVATLNDLATLADYSFMDTLNCDPEGKANGADHAPRQVFSGHYVPVKPTPIENPEYVAHGKNLFHELGFDDSMAQSSEFVRMFSGDLSGVPEPLRNVGWACVAQEHMHALGVPTSRSLSLYVSKTEKVMRPWYSEGSRSIDPDILISEPVAISTRLAPDRS